MPKKPAKHAPPAARLRKKKQTESPLLKGAVPYERARGQKTRS